MAGKVKDRGGRPRIRPIQAGEKVQIGVRITPELRSHLDKAAKKSGRSLTQEAELRLERSVDALAVADRIAQFTEANQELTRRQVQMIETLLQLIRSLHRSRGVVVPEGFHERAEEKDQRK